MKYRHRFKSRGARSRITKGKSSESNPSVTRHREAARATHIVQKIQADKSYNVKFGDEDAVLEQIPLHKMQIDDAEEIKTIRSNFSELTSAQSQLSQFTSCTNPTFDPVHPTAELIKDTNGTESDAEYFAALLTIIEAMPAVDESKLAAAAYLLGLVAKKVNKSVSQKCFSRAHEILENKLDKTQLDVALAKLIATLGVILHQQAASIWQNIVEAVLAMDELKLTAATYLLSFVVKKVCKSVSQKCFSRVHEIGAVRIFMVISIKYSTDLYYTLVGN
ncbi:unnamed protein product [Brugia timori]|uniref:NUC173 domain-containing protein n=1 Tax=Brugia timori TaxID=42155 RepID=A0A0R3R8Y7_9BILA|nr:unnamed protein product [Brugia timori]